MGPCRRRCRRGPLWGVAVLAGLIALAAAPGTASAEATASGSAQPLGLLVAVALLSLAPFLFISVTSFAKISVVLSILRHAIGTPQVPSGAVVSGLALILTLYVMAPVLSEIRDEALPALRSSSASEGLFAGADADAIVEAASRARDPIRRFLRENASRQNVQLFASLAARRAGSAAPGPDDLQVLAPAFIVTELTEGFLVGFLLFVPFLVIDIVVSNVLLSLGMHMLSPTTISLPMKLLLFVLVDGWRLVCYGLVTGYS
jgi:type III secretion protein R